jgi:hypothetical protein
VRWLCILYLNELLGLVLCLSTDHKEKACKIIFKPHINEHTKWKLLELSKSKHVV